MDLYIRSDSPVPGSGDDSDTGDGDSEEPGMVEGDWDLPWPLEISLAAAK